MNKFLFLVCLCTVLPSCPDTFIVKKKRETSSKLKEKSCQALEDILHLCIDIHEEMAQIQRHSLHESCKFLENDSQSFFAHATKEQLQIFIEHSQELITDMEHCKETLRNYKTYMTTLK